MPETGNAKDCLELPPTNCSIFTLKNVTWRTYLISFTVQYCFLFRFVCIELVSLIWFLQIWVAIYVYGTMINWSTLIKKLMQTYIVIVSGSILNVSTVHLNGIWHLIWRYLSKPVLGGHYSIPRGCPLNTGFTVFAPFALADAILKRERRREVWTLLNCLGINSSARVQGLDLFCIPAPAPAPCPNFLAWVIEKGCVQIHEINVVSHTQYIIEVHPSIVMHWKTVIIATAMLSKVVMPSFGPTQPSLQMKPSSHFLPRNICLTPLNGPLSHGLGFSSIKPARTDGQGLKYWVWVAKGL